MYTVDAIEFTSVCFCIELRQPLVGEKYHSLENVQVICCLMFSPQSLSSECVSVIEVLGYTVKENGLN
jgi:predicted amidohydrolase